MANIWDDIASFEAGEVKNDSKNPNLANARQAARMDAYIKLFWRSLE